MKEKRKNPYQMLLEEIQKFCFNIEWPHKVFMWGYTKASLSTSSYRLDGLAERVQAGNQLGYEVVLEIGSDGQLNVFYRKKIEIPYHWRNS